MMSHIEDSDLQLRLHHIESRYSRRRTIINVTLMLSVFFVLFGLFQAYTSTERARWAEFSARRHLIALETKLTEQTEISWRKIQALEASLTESSAKLQEVQAELVENRNRAQNVIDNITQRTIHVGDAIALGGPDRNMISLPCGYGSPRVKEVAEARSPTGLRLLRLDRITSFSGGRCGHTFFSATYVPA